MTVESQDPITEYNNLIGTIKNNLDSIITKFKEPDDFFMPALNNLKYVAPEIKETPDAIDKINKRIKFLRDLSAVIEEICKLQALLLNDKQQGKELQKKLAAVNNALNHLKESHKEAIQYDKFFYRLLLGVSIFGLVAVIVIPLLLLNVSETAFAISFIVGLATYLAVNIPLLYIANINKQNAHVLFFVNLIDDKKSDFERDYSALSENLENVRI